MHPDIYSINVTALEKVQPKDLSASEIDVRLGNLASPDVIKDFIFELLETPYMYRRYIDVFIRPIPPTGMSKVKTMTAAATSKPM